MLGYDYDDYTPIYTHIELGKNKYLITTTINTLVFKELKMDEFGQYDKNTVINQHIISFANLHETSEFKSLLTNVYDSKLIFYRGLKIDFTLYDRKIVDILIDHINWIERFMPRVTQI